MAEVKQGDRNQTLKIDFTPGTQQPQVTDPGTTRSGSRSGSKPSGSQPPPGSRVPGSRSLGGNPIGLVRSRSAGSKAPSGSQTNLLKSPAKPHKQNKANIPSHGGTRSPSPGGEDKKKTKKKPAAWRTDRGKVHGLARRKGDPNPRNWGLAFDSDLEDHPAFHGSSKTPPGKKAKKKDKSNDDGRGKAALAGVLALGKKIFSGKK